MATPYSKIYERALAKITDYDLAFLPDDDFRFMIRGWLNSSISKFRKCASDLSDRDDELEVFNVDLVDEEIEILAMLIVCEWLEPQVNSVNLTLQIFGGKEGNYGVNRRNCSGRKSQNHHQFWRVHRAAGE